MMIAYNLCTGVSSFNFTLLLLRQTSPSRSQDGGGGERERNRLDEEFRTLRPIVLRQLGDVYACFL